MIRNSAKAILVSAFLALLFAAHPASAAIRCETQYGGGEVCIRTGELQIDKEVFNPQEKKFVDNLGLTSHKFSPGQEITFKITVKNVGDATFSRVTVTDNLPAHLELVSGSLNYEIRDLSPGETDTREFKVRVVSADRFPASKTTICEVNVAEAHADGEHDRDTSQVCLEKKVVAPKELPKAGPEDALLLLVSSLGLLLGGALVLRKANSIA